MTQNIIGEFYTNSKQLASPSGNWNKTLSENHGYQL